MSEAPGLDDLLDEARRHPIRGWDFGWLVRAGRFDEGSPPWDYGQLVARRASGSPDLLDLGTGGGERLAALAPHPARTVATEAYGPNVSVAARRLGPLGISVVRIAGAPDNNAQAESNPAPSLPFRARSFHLVIDRNESFVAGEVARILAPGGVFLTEQTGSSELEEFYRLLGFPPPPPSRSWDLGLARHQATRAGLSLADFGEARFAMTFRDVGALVWYLLAVPWAAPDFSLDRYRDRLATLHARVRRQGPIRIPRYGFWLEAVKRA